MQLGARAVRGHVGTHDLSEPGAAAATGSGQRESERVSRHVAVYAAS